MPLDEHIGGGHGECEARLKICPAPMHHLLQMTDERQHREHRLHQHPVLPLAALTQLEVGRIALRGMEARIAQDDHLLFALADEPLKGVICDIGRGTRPRDDQSPLIEQQTEFTADDPAMIREAFAADLPGAAAFADRMDELDPIGIDDAEHRRRGQESLRPVLMSREETKDRVLSGSCGNSVR